MPKFLILRFSSIGDIVLTTPVIRCLKLQIPQAEVHFATKISYQSLLENNPYIDKLHLLNHNDNELINQLKKEKFDYVIDLHHNIRTLKIKWSLGVKSYSFNKINIQKWLMVNFKWNTLPKEHIVDRNLATLSTFGVINDNLGLDYFIPEKDKVSIIDLWPNLNEYAVFAIGGQHFTKKLPPNKIFELIKKQSIPVVMVGGKEDENTAHEILALNNNIGEIYTYCGKGNLNQSASIIAQSAYVISHDTGMMHVAAALKKKVISIWGNTIPEFGMYPYGTTYEVIENKNLNCRPCSKIGYKTCPKGHFKCMNELNFQ